MDKKNLEVVVDTITEVRDILESVLVSLKDNDLQPWEVYFLINRFNRKIPLLNEALDLNLKHIDSKNINN